MTDENPTVSTPEGQEIGDENKLKAKRRFDQRDFDQIAEFIVQEHRDRKDRRKHLAKVWKEIDRQLRMEPDLTGRMDASTKTIRAGAEWMPAVELPLQAQTLETLTADARGMMFPDSGEFFEAHAALTDDYLSRVDFQALIAGEENEVPSRINQDNADKLVEGFLSHYHDRYDFRGHWDALNAEAFKYGTFCGRARLVTKSIFLPTARGIVRKDQRIPVLFPASIKSVYLDDSKHHLMHEGFMVGPSTIRCERRLVQDVIMAAQKGSNDPDKEDGGWMPMAAARLDGDDTGHVELLEYEGDLIVPRKTVRSVFVPNVIVTVAVDPGAAKVIRFRFQRFSFGSYLTQHYHVEDVESPYGVGPLMKGMPIQVAATEALNRLMGWAILNTEPPIQYDRSDPWFAMQGGPVIAPRELWGTIGKVQPIEIGDGVALQSAYVALLNQYYDVTGVNAPRLGAQTVSHTTAYSKSVEAQRGVVRTVDYVKTVNLGPMTRWLHMEFEMAKQAMKGEETFYIRPYGGFVTLKKEHLPDLVSFDVFGSGGPQEEQAALAKRLQAFQIAAQLDPLKIQTGGKPMDYESAQKEILRQGGWTDLDVFFPAQPAQSPVGGVPGAAAGGSGVPPALIGSARAVTPLISGG